MSETRSMTPPMARNTFKLNKPKTRSNSTDFLDTKTMHQRKFERYRILTDPKFETDKDDNDLPNIPVHVTSKLFENKVKHSRHEKDVNKRWVLGEGAFGYVYKALDVETDTTVAVKLFKNQSKHVTRREASTMMRLHHEHIVHMLDFFVYDSQMHIVYELVHYGDLYDWLVEKYDNGDKSGQRAMTNSVSFAIAKQIAQALTYCHTRGIAHRDLKPENVLIAQLEPDIKVKVVDFGLSYVICKGMSRFTNEIGGTADYAAPEIFHSDESSVDPFLGDAWSYGILIYVTLHFCYPFSRKQIAVAYSSGRRITIDVAKHVPKQMCDILSSALTVDPYKRVLVQDMLFKNMFDDVPEDEICTPPSEITSTGTDSGTVVYHGNDTGEDDEIFALSLSDETGLSNFDAYKKVLTANSE